MRSLLEGERVVFARYTAPRDLAGVLANLRLARRLMAGGRFARVISTGSAIALSFLPLARALGVPCHYIESTALTALEIGKAPLLVPRVHAHGEHVDDHQAQTARELAGRGLAVEAGAGELTLDHLLAAAAIQVVRTDDPPPVVLADRARTSR